jgi:peptidyl-prolyl cis-trans isomerase D
VTVALIPSELARWVEISDDDLKRAYEERRARYVTPERRHILQIDFPNLEAAREAGERAAKGTGFAEIAKELGKTEKDIDLGMVTKAGLVDRAVADAAFALKEGEVSAPVQGRFGPVLVQVVKVDPEKVRSFEEVSGELKQELGTGRAKAEVQDLYNKIEDARSEGKTLAEAAATLKLEARTFEAVDRSGRDPSGNPVSGLPEQQRILTTAFNTEIGIERDPLQVQDGYVWFEVAGITPSRERTLDEVKAQVEQRWQEDEIAKRLDAKATEIMDKLKGGSTFAEVASPLNLKVQTATGVKRGQRSGVLSSAAVDAVFRTAKDALGKADASQPVEQVVFRVTGIVVPASDLASEEAKRLIETLDRGISEDMLSEYISRLESEIGVTINQTALNQVIGGGAADAN